MNKTEVVYKGKMFEVIQWEGTPGKTFEAAVRAPGIRLLIESGSGLRMTRELRRESEGYDYRLPGGKVFDTLEEYAIARGSMTETDRAHIAEKAKEAAVREAREEAGVESGEFIPLSVSKAGASVEWDLHYFLVKNAILGEQSLEESEVGNIEIAELSANEIFNKLVGGEIKEGRSADMLWKWLAENRHIQFLE